MSDGIFSPAPTKPPEAKSAGQQAAERGPRTDPIPGQPKRKRRTKAELEAAGAASKPKRSSALAVFRACVKHIRELTRPEAERVIEMLKAVVDA